jgi:hypothetical protein
MEKAYNILIRDVNDLSCYTSLGLLAFNGLVEEAAENLKMTTFRGKSVITATPIPEHASS